MRPFFPEPPLHDFPDRAIRLLSEYPAHLREVVQATAPSVAGLMDFPRTTPLRRDLPMPDWRRREPDLLFHVPFLPGQPLTASMVCVLLEHSSQPDQRTPLRALLYAVLYWEREWHAWETQHKRGTLLRLTPVLPIVFATGPTAWDAPLSFVELFGDPGPLRPFIPTWQPLLWDVAAHSVEDLLTLTGEWLPSMAVVRAEDESPERFRQVFAEVLGRLAPLNQTEQTRWQNLMWFLLSWAIRRRSGAERADLLAESTANLQNAQLQQEIQIMASQVGQRWEDEVFARGEVHGGVAKSRHILRKVLEAKCGTLPEGLLQQIQAILDVDRLDQAVIRAAQVTRLEDFSL